MKITKHETIFRSGKNEYPFTAELDGGDILDDIIFSEKVLKDTDLDDCIEARIVAYENKPAPKIEAILTVDEVEAVLKSKTLMLPDEEWEAWKDKTATITAVK